MSPDKQPRKFKDIDTFSKWAKRHLKERKDDLKSRITPH